MTFTLTATPEPSHTPPRVLLEAVESDPDKPLQSCTFFRDGVALRFAATVAADTAVAYDYDAPFDVSLEYRADAVEADALVLDWTETWASLAAWTVLHSGWSAAGGFAVASTDQAYIRRASSGSIARIVGPAPTLTGSFYVLTPDATIAFDSAGPSITLTTNAGSDTVSHAFTSWTMDIGPTSVTASGTGWSLTAARSGSLTETGIVDLIFLGVGSVAFDDFSVYKFASTTSDVSDTDTTSLTGVTAAWLTNAANPDLALAIDDCSDADPDYYMTEETGRTKTSRSSSVQLDIEGSRDVRTVVTGPRKTKTSVLEVVCKNDAALDDLDDLLANNATLNLRMPATMTDLGVVSGFYDVGDVTETRVDAPRITQKRIVSMPLTPSSGVSFDALWQWTYDALAQTGLTYDQAAALFPTYTDLLVGPTT